jgi:hypothetical protein
MREEGLPWRGEFFSLPQRLLVTPAGTLVRKLNLKVE